MTSPDIRPHAPLPDEILENRRNGQGYWMFMPTPAAPLDETLPVLGDYGDFTEIPEIVDEVATTKAVLIEGAPGSGKSHLVKDLQTACVLNNLPAFCLSTHINAGKGNGIETIRPLLDEFQAKVHDTGGGLVILDNLDYVGYRGSSRTRSRSVGYAASAVELVDELIENPDLAVIATSHDDDWREGKWTWDDPEIDDPAKAILEKFQSSFVFEGKMALMGLAHILTSRTRERCENVANQAEGVVKEVPISVGEAAQVMRMLEESGRANFFHARHLPVQLFLQNPGAAIAKIERGRAERRGQA